MTRNEIKAVAFNQFCLDKANLILTKLVPAETEFAILYINVNFITNKIV